MQNLSCAALILALLSTPALSQQPTAPPPAAEGPRNDAINTGDRVATAPVKGANSFTEEQARERIAARGFTGISRLTKDADGIWRGTALRGGQSVAVSLDYTGAVFPQ
jgi:hypothetical protein